MNDRSGARSAKDVPQVPEVDVHQAARLAEQGHLILDVRETSEWASGHMPGATHVPLGSLADTLTEGDRPVVAVCRSGNRSRKAAAALAARGVDVVNMAGGMVTWQEAGLPVVTDAGTPGSI